MSARHAVCHAHDTCTTKQHTFHIELDVGIPVGATLVELDAPANPLPPANEEKEGEGGAAEAGAPRRREKETHQAKDHERGGEREGGGKDGELPAFGIEWPCPRAVQIWVSRGSALKGTLPRAGSSVRRPSWGPFDTLAGNGPPRHGVQRHIGASGSHFDEEAGLGAEPGQTGPGLRKSTTLPKFEPEAPTFVKFRDDLSFLATSSPCLRPS